MDSAMNDVFEAVGDHARRSKSHFERMRALGILAAARLKAREIYALKQERKAMRAAIETRRADLNGTVTTFDLHPIELEAIKFLCPDADVADWQAKKKAWEWILAQPWAQEFKSSPLEKRFH